MADGFLYRVCLCISGMLYIREVGRMMSRGAVGASLTNNIPIEFTMLLAPRITDSGFRVQSMTARELRTISRL